MGLRAAWSWTARALASALFSSHLPVRILGHLGGERRWTGAGFVGTLWGLAVFLVLPSEPGPFAAAFVVALLAAVAASGEAERSYGRKDDPRIVVDEVLGFFAAAAFLPRTGPVLVAAFVLFRIFDAWKPPFIRPLERLPGGWGVVMDDVGAGVAANLILQACVRFL